MTASQQIPAQPVGNSQPGSNDAENKRRAAQLASDLLPACPSCGDLCPAEAVWCACGARLVERGTTGRFRWYRW